MKNVINYINMTQIVQNVIIDFLLQIFYLKSFIHIIHSTIDVLTREITRGKQHTVLR